MYNEKIKDFQTIENEFIAGEKKHLKVFNKKFCKNESQINSAIREEGDNKESVDIISMCRKRAVKSSFPKLKYPECKMKGVNAPLYTDSDVDQYQTVIKNALEPYFIALLHFGRNIFVLIMCSPALYLMYCFCKKMIIKILIKHNAIRFFLFFNLLLF